MFKRYVAIFTAIFFTITLFPYVFVESAYAYQNNTYFNNLKVGLVSMSTVTDTVTLNGDYTINGQVYPSGSILNLGVNGTSITLNGILMSQLTITPNNNGNLLTITSGSITNKYMGSFLVKVYNGKVLPINIIDIESYLKGVVGYEMSDNFPIESLKTQAVAARNYALSRLGWEAAKGYDFDDTTAYQVYKGYNANYTNVISAVEQTRGQVLLYNDALVETLYSAWHGGISENSENVWGNYVPYLRSVVDSYENDPWPNGNRILTNTQIQTTLVTKGLLSATDTFISLDLNSITKFPSGRISNINIIYKNSTGLTQTKAVTKDSTRTFLALPSNLYTVTYDAVNGAYTFTGRGNGHGLGMSQIGARNRAAAGQTYDTILKFYYTNTYLQNLILKASLSSFSQSSNSMFVQNSISFTAAGAGGNGYGYLYKYIIKNGSNIVLTKDYSNSSALSFVPSSPGSYTVEAYVKDSFSISDYDDKKISTFNVYFNPTLNSFTLNKTATLVGQGVSTNIDVQSGSGSYLYKYEVTKDGQLLTTRDFGADKTYSYMPSQAGSYTVTAYVKDSISPQTYDFKQSQNFSAYDNLSFTSFNKDDVNVFQGDTVNFSAATTGGSNNGTSYKYVVIKDGQMLTTRDFSSDNTFAYVPSSSGSYEVDVYAVDAASDNSYDAQTKMTFDVNPRASISSLTIDKSTAFVNDTFTINAAGSSTNPLYKFVISKDGTTAMTKDYDVNASLTYIPTNPGSYKVDVYTKDSLSLKDYDDVKTLSFNVLSIPIINTLQSNKAQYIAGQTISLNTSATLGSGNYLYKYVVENAGIVLSTIDYSNNTSFDYKTDNAGTYTITEYMKDALSSKAYDDKMVLSVPVYSQPTATFTSTQASVVTGSAVNYTLGEVNGSGTAQYRFVVMKGTNVVVDSGYTYSKTYSFTPTDSGTYAITGYMKDALSENTFDSQNTLSLNVYSPVLSVTTANGYFYIGKTIAFNSSSNGVSPLGFSYKYEVYYNNVLVTSSNFSSLSNFTYAPVNSGTYTIKVYGKDGLSTKTYDSMKQFNINISSKPLYLSVLPLSYGMTNTSVTSLQNALIKLGYSITSPNGYFGTDTKSASIAFQKSKGLTQDGIVGNMTYGALNDALIEKAGTGSLTF